MKFAGLIALCLAAVAVASPSEEDNVDTVEEHILSKRQSPGYCPVTYCKIDTRKDPYYNFAYLRQNACNNNNPIQTLYDGNIVYDLGVKPKYGCNYYYTQVLVTNKGGNKVGWVASHLINCQDPAYRPPASYSPPAPASGTSS